MNKVLIAYTSMSGSTGEVAQVIGEQLATHGWQAEVMEMEQVGDLSAYQAVVLGAPMVIGWHRSARRFLKQKRRSLDGIPLAIFTTAMSLIANGEVSVAGVPLYVDRSLAQPPRNPSHLSLKESHSSLAHYASPILQAAGNCRPISLAFFGGKMDYQRLKLLPRLFVMLVIQAAPGDRRDWQGIRGWADSLAPQFQAKNRTN